MVSVVARLRRIALLLLGVLLVGGVLLTAFQRRLLFFPTVVTAKEAARLAEDGGALPFTVDGAVVGWRFPKANATDLLLSFHGNAGMALDRDYLAQTLGAVGFEVIVVEYPGYGARPGAPSEAAFFDAATSAFDALARDEARPVYVLGESIGSGAACHLAAVRGDRLAGLTLVTPFDKLASPAADHFPWLPISLILKDRFENDRALVQYKGRLAVLLAARDTVVPAVHGQRLFDGYQGPKQLFIDAKADHNDLPWRANAPVWREMAAFLRSKGPSDDGQ